VTTTQGGLLKMDTRGRVRTSRERRRAILAEFDQSGVSAAQFAKLTGLRYSTFAAWVQRRRKPKPGKSKAVTPAAAARRPALRLVEAVVDPAAERTSGQALVLHLPGQVRLEITSPTQVPLVAALLQALQPPAARC
jgi:transposase-like protein